MKYVYKFIYSIYTNVCIRMYIYNRDTNLCIKRIDQNNKHIVGEKATCSVPEGSMGREAWGVAPEDFRNCPVPITGECPSQGTSPRTAEPCWQRREVPSEVPTQGTIMIEDG